LICMGESVATHRVQCCNIGKIWQLMTELRALGVTVGKGSAFFCICFYHGFMIAGERACELNTGLNC
jgi:hypothetical protein